MAIKITLEIKQDPDVGGPPDAMQEMFNRLTEVAGLPAGGFKVTFLAADEGGVDRIREELEAAFEDRPYCIIATIDRKDDKADLRRRRIDGPTPIERELGENLGRRRTGRAAQAATAFGDAINGLAGVNRVELSAGGRTVTLTPETRRNAQRALERVGMGDDDDSEEGNDQ